jgi:hypothetical protein
MATVGYELRALVGQAKAIDLAVSQATASSVTLSQGLALLPLPDELFDRLGGGEHVVFGDAFYYLSSGIQILARSASAISPVAYLEADLFGGCGTQAAVAWADGKLSLGPIVTVFEPTAPPPASRPEWAFNRVLRQLGAETGESIDEFAAVGLGGSRRSTLDWTNTEH